MIWWQSINRIAVTRQPYILLECIVLPSRKLIKILFCFCLYLCSCFIMPFWFHHWLVNANTLLEDGRVSYPHYSLRYTEKDLSHPSSNSGREKLYRPTSRCGCGCWEQQWCGRRRRQRATTAHLGAHVTSRVISRTRRHNSTLQQQKRRVARPMPTRSHAVREAYWPPPPPSVVN